jgi:hypothetical protein
MRQVRPAREVIYNMVSEYLEVVGRLAQDAEQAAVETA